MIGFGAATLGLLAVMVGVLPSAIQHAFADNITASQDNLRTGWDQNEDSLAPSTITSTNFGQLFATKVQGQVYGQPLVVGDTLVVGTEDNYVYGLDAKTGDIKWQRSLGAPWPASAVGCADLVPNLGNTSTGVYDPVTGDVYLTTKVNDGSTVKDPSWYLHRMSLTTGEERTGWPLKIMGTPSNDLAHPFKALDVNQRPALLLSAGSVYMAFGGQCDIGTYVGWVAGINTTTQAINMWSDEVGATSYKAGIWQAGGGLVSDGDGRMFLATGNGLTPPDAAGTNPPQQMSEAVVRLGVAADGALSSKDFFSPSNAAQLDRNDQDLASGAPVGLPSEFGTAAIPHLMLQIGKDGRLFVLNRDHLGGKNQKSGGGDDVVQVLGPYQGVWGKPGIYGGEGGYAYAVQNRGTMLAFKYGVDGSGKPTFSLAGSSAESFGYTSGSPIVTSDATTPGSAVVWATNVDGPTGANGRLCAYSAVPANNHINLLRCFPIGTAVKFATAASSGGRVYTGTRDGYVFGFGQPTTAALQTAQADFGNVKVSETGTATVTVTAARTVTINAITTSGAPFTANPPALPATLTAGQQMSVPVSFAPTDPGSFTGALKFSLDEAGVSETFGAGLQGNAIKPGLTASPSTLDFGEIAIGTSKYLTVTVTNTGTTDETVSSLTSAEAPFAVSGLPEVGTVLQPGQSVSAKVTYQPTVAGADQSSLTVGGTLGDAKATLTGKGVVGQSELTVTPEALNFGAVPICGSATRTLTVENTGNLPVTVTKAAPPTLPFVVNTPLPEGLVLNPGDTASVEVTFAPTAAGSFSNPYVISSDDGNGAHSIPVTGTAAGLPDGKPLPAVARGGWFLNGSAKLSGADVVLTPNTPHQAGSAVYSTPLPSNGLSASFTAQIGAGAGADGMTFSLLSAAANTGKSLGSGGGGLGVAGLQGVAIALDTFKNTAAEPSNNFVGISTTSANGSLTYLATAINPLDLRKGVHGVKVTVSGTTVTVYVDGGKRLSVNVPGLSPSVLPAFTGGTGGYADVHTARDIVITSGGTTLARPGTGWRFNGSTTVAGSQTVLTPAAQYKAGTALYATPVGTDGLTASFNLSMSGGTGADGATFVLLDPAAAYSTSVGANGSGLGFGGLPGVAVTFVTYPEGGIASHNFVGIATSTAGGKPVFLSSTTKVPDLRAQDRDVVVSISGNKVSVAIDGTDVLSTAVAALKPTATVGFSASTGGVTDVHAITDAQIVTGRTAMSPPPGGWTHNGSATISGGRIQLTAAANGQTGTGIFGAAVPTARLEAEFTMQIGGGKGGADGLTFMLLDPAKAKTTALGRGGDGLGFAGLTGVAVSFITYPQGGINSHNFAGIETSTAAGATFVAHSTAVPNLRSGTHEVNVSVASGKLVVTIDGKALFNTAVTGIPANALVGFSGSTGGLNDVHAVNNLHIAY